VGGNDEHKEKRGENGANPGVHPAQKNQSVHDLPFEMTTRTGGLNRTTVIPRTELDDRIFKWLTGGSQ
jgi:hypothetical protein